MSFEYIAELKCFDYVDRADQRDSGLVKVV